MSISIILLNWNRKEEILKTLKSLKNQTYKDFEVIVIDQGSDDGSIQIIRKDFPEVKLTCLDRNVGVPGGRNIGASKAKGEICVFVDNDAHLINNALEDINERFKDDEKLGIMGFKVVNAKTGKLDLSSWPYQKSKIKDSEKEFDTYTFCGGGHAIKREIFQKVGYYWDELFFSWEEMSLSLRVLDAGYKIIYNPNVILYHRISEENRTSNALHECMRLKNSLWVSWRYMPRGYAILETVFRVPAYLIKGMRKGCFFKMLAYLFMALKRINLLFDNSHCISKEALKKYKQLSDKGPILDQLRHLFFKA